MTRDLFRTAGVLAVLLCAALSARGQVLRGTAINGTTGKPAAGDDAVLLKPGQQMTEVARTKTNARGEFTFQLPDAESVWAVRVQHHKVNFFAPVPPRNTTVTVTVYESADAVPGIHQLSQSVIFQAQGNTAQVFEVFNLRNDSQPPRAQPSFSFYLPPGADVKPGQAVREQGMPLRIAPVPEGNDKYTIFYTLLPGDTHIEVAYQLPYTGTLAFQPRLSGTVDRFYVVTPKGMTFSAQSASQYQRGDIQTISPDLAGMDMHVAGGTTDEKQLAFTVTGEGVIPQEAGQQGGQEGNSRQGDDNRPGIGLNVPNTNPNPLSSGQWAFLGVLSVFLAGGGVMVFMMARPQARATPAVAIAAAAAAHGVSAHAAHSPSLLDALKDEMFQLEADRLQGNINVHDYEAAKAALTKTLQRAMAKK